MPYVGRRNFYFSGTPAVQGVQRGTTSENKILKKGKDDGIRIYGYRLKMPRGERKLPGRKGLIREKKKIRLRLPRPGG